MTLLERRKTEQKETLKKQIFRFFLSLTVVVFLSIVCCKIQAYASINVQLGSGEGDGTFGTLQLLFLFAVLALAPSILVMMTSFTRIVIVLSFVRNALGVQNSPPNQVLVGLALFLSLFIMSPVLQEINEKAIEPYMNEQITQEVALDEVQKPLKVFMLKQTKVKELNLFLSISGQAELEEVNTETLTNLGLEVIVPAFVTSELKRAFMIGFLLFIPFLVIDMIVASTLMAMGMVMLPPSMIALPFKLMLFVVVDGWDLLIGALIRSFQT